GIAWCRALVVRSVGVLTAISISGLTWAAEKTSVPVKKPAATSGKNNISIELFGNVPRQELTLREAIELALANNLDAKFENKGISIERGRVNFAAGVFDPVFSINTADQSLRRLENVNDVRSADVIRQNQAVASNIALSQQLFDQNNINLIALGQAPRPETERPTVSRELTTTNFSSTTFDAQSFQLESGIVGRTPWGMRYGVQASGSRIRNTFSGDSREIIPEYETQGTLTVIQPLLRGFGTNVNLADLRIARLNHQIQVLEWKDRVTATVQGVMAAYIDMAYALREVRVREEAVTSGQKLVDYYTRRVELGFNSPIDIRQAEVQVSSDREVLIVAKNVFLERQFALKRLILAEYDRETPRLYIPSEVPRLATPKLDRTGWLQLAYQRRYDYQQALLTADAQDVRLSVAKNQLLPQLDLVASYGLNGLGTSIGQSLEQGADGRTPTWSVGVNFSIPLGNVQPRANLSIARGLKEQALIRIKQAEVTVGTDVDQILSRIVLSQQRVATAIQTRQVAEQLERIGIRRLEEGLVSSFDIIDIQRRLYEARTRELAAQAEFNRSVTQLWLVSATVLEKMGIQFVEPRKPY
ncbi:MAG TPA: TolC family protein, partial [Chthoniobacteraceae bacterium]|nr:TolC family protein [Chthoniobacteraceae bacterium]